MIKVKVGKVTTVGKSVEEQMEKKPQSEITFKMGKVRSIPHSDNSQREESTKKEIWVTFNSNGSICSTSDKQPATKCDKWDNAWQKMVSE
jgi:hypothetical protein